MHRQERWPRAEHRVVARFVCRWRASRKLPQWNCVRRSGETVEGAHPQRQLRCWWGWWAENPVSYVRNHGTKRQHACPFAVIAPQSTVCVVFFPFLPQRDYRLQWWGWQIAVLEDVHDQTPNFAVWLPRHSTKLEGGGLCAIVVGRMLLT